MRRRELIISWGGVACDGEILLDALQVYPSRRHEQRVRNRRKSCIAHSGISLSSPDRDLSLGLPVVVWLQ